MAEIASFGRKDNFRCAKNPAYPTSQGNTYWFWRALTFAESYSIGRNTLFRQKGTLSAEYRYRQKLIVSKSSSFGYQQKEKISLSFDLYLFLHRCTHEEQMTEYKFSMKLLALMTGENAGLRWLKKLVTLRLRFRSPILTWSI